MTIGGKVMVLGIRCSNNDFTYCIISGVKDSPVINTRKKIRFPLEFSEAESLLWFYRELHEIFENDKIVSVGIKRTEGNVKRSKHLELRIQYEAIVSLVAAEIGITKIYRKVKSTIAKDLGLKGKAKYLDTRLDTSPIDNFDSFLDKEKEAFLTAWSCMD